MSQNPVSRNHSQNTGKYGISWLVRGVRNTIHHKGWRLGYSSNRTVGFLYDKESHCGSGEARLGWNVHQWEMEDTKTHSSLNYELVIIHHQELWKIHLPYRLRWDRKGKESFIIHVRFHAKGSGGGEDRLDGDSKELWPGHENRENNDPCAWSVSSVTHMASTRKCVRTFTSSTGKSGGRGGGGRKTVPLVDGIDLSTSVHIFYQGSQI